MVRPARAYQKWCNGVLQMRTWAVLAITNGWPAEERLTKGPRTDEVQIAQILLQRLSPHAMHILVHDDPWLRIPHESYPHVVDELVRSIRTFRALCAIQDAVVLAWSPRCVYVDSFSNHATSPLVHSARACESQGA